MTGASFVLPGQGGDSDDEDDGDIRLELTEAGASRRRAVEWVGKPHVVGPPWMKMPLLTVGMLGLQCVWSIEMGYASPYLLELGLSKSLMSLVFVAGPLSGLIMQPLIGVMADRSKSRFGRRRPFMLIGCAVSIFAMMILGWAREISSIFGGGKIFAIIIAVFAIYLIDFSINAVMSADRALVVDTLPSSQQEKGNAWAGRMFGVGSLAGFYVGNINLVSIFPIFGRTQLQVLSFLTSAILIMTNGLTAYSVKERVLLRDNRPQSSGHLVEQIKGIWSAIFTLPPSIRSICFIQFFAWIGWFPILFFTSVWVGEIYTREAIAGGRSAEDPTLLEDATRAGSRALFLNALVNLTTSVFLPFLVSSSGILPPNEMNTANTPTIKRSREESFSRSLARGSTWMGKANFWGALPQWFRMQIPIQGLTLIRVWMLGQGVFTFTMACTWFAGSTAFASAVIALNGFCWAVAQWAPFSLLGELILLDSGAGKGNEIPMTNSVPTVRLNGPRSHSPSSGIYLEDRTAYAVAAAEEEEALIRSVENAQLDVPEPSGSRSSSRASNRTATASPSQGNGRFSKPGTSTLSPELGSEASGASRSIESGHRSSEDSFKTVGLPEDEAPVMAAREESVEPEPAHRSEASGTSEKAGIILGIHNIFLVMPQFLVTILSSIIFFLTEPTRPSLPSTHAGTGFPSLNNSTAEVIERIYNREIEIHVTGGTDSVGLIFRLGGISSAIAGYMCWRLSRDWARGNV